MGSVSVSCYKRGPGCEKELLELVRNHPEPLRDLGLVTERSDRDARFHGSDRRSA